MACEAKWIKSCRNITLLSKVKKRSTLGCSNKVVSKFMRSCALQQADSLLVKLSAGDSVAQDAVYPSPCLVALYNKAFYVGAPALIYGLIALM